MKDTGNFLMIKNSLIGTYGQPETSKFYSIGTRGFTILSVLLWFNKNNSVFMSPYDIKTFIPFIGTKNTINKYLSSLKSNHLINCDKDLLHLGLQYLMTLQARAAFNI